MIFIKETNKEFQEFLSESSERPPKILEEKVFNIVHKELNPGSWNVFSKISFIHMIAGLITLSLCPQFGFRLFGEGPGLMSYFLIFGIYGCTALCGAFFIGTSFFVSSLVLKQEEVNVLKRHKWLQISSVTFISLGAFIMIDTEIILGFALSWIVGSIVGGFAMFELGQFIKINFKLRA